MEARADLVLSFVTFAEICVRDEEDGELNTA